MSFGNNIEKYGFDKSTWPIVEVNDLPDGGQEIYMGKSRRPNASTSDPVWLVRKITVRKRDSVTTILTEETSDWNNSWENHSQLIYQLI